MKQFASQLTKGLQTNSPMCTTGMQEGDMDTLGLAKAKKYGAAEATALAAEAAVYIDGISLVLQSGDNRLRLRRAVTFIVDKEQFHCK